MIWPWYATGLLTLVGVAAVGSLAIACLMIRDEVQERRRERAFRRECAALIENATASLVARLDELRRKP